MFVTPKNDFMIPGEFILGDGDIECNANRPTCKLTVVNTGDRPVQIGSHFHFFEVNKQLLLDRSRAFGMRLNIAAGTAVRFEPGEEKEVELVKLGGNGVAFGLNNLVNGNTTEENKSKALKNAEQSNFKSNSL
jgi:urease subunit beta